MAAAFEKFGEGVVSGTKAEASKAASFFHLEGKEQSNTGTATKDGRVSQTTMFGGTGGSAFEDAVTTKHLQEIRMRGGGRLDSIQCVYEGGQKTEYHGGQGGSEHIFRLGRGEAIITVNIWAQGTVDAIQFRTTQGRLSRIYGWPYTEANICRGFAGHERALMGFRGRAAGEVDALEPLWSNSQELGKTAVSVGEERGGYGGSIFDMIDTIGDPLKEVLTEVKVRSGERINGIECIFRNGRSSGARGSGEGGGSFKLNENERIVSIEGRAAERIDQLQFVTDAGRRSDLFGGEGGSPFVWTPPSTEENMCLLCFQGRAGREIDRLSAVWAIDPPIKFELDITNVTLPDINTIGQPEGAWSSRDEVENKKEEKATMKINFSQTITKSSTISLSKDSRTKVGGKQTMGAKVSGGVGIPLITKAEVEVSSSLEVSAEHEWGKTITDGETSTATSTKETSIEVSVPAKTITSAKAITYALRTQSVKWTGTMTVTYAGGGQKQYPVDGEFDSVNATVSRVELSDTKLGTTETVKREETIPLESKK